MFNFFSKKISKKILTNGDEIYTLGGFADVWHICR